MTIKYPRFHISDHPSDFYTWYQESKSSRAMWSGWIKGDTSLWYRLQNTKLKDRQKMIIDLSDKVH